jgi:hypothetical protein
MKHYIIVLSIILFVSLTFFYPSIIEDASFNDYNYLRDLRRSNNTIDNDYTKQKLYENTTFNTPGTTGTSSGNSSSSSSVGISPIVYSNITPTVKQPEQKKDNSTESKSSTNLLPYLLLLLLLMVVIIVYVKYKMN